MSIQNSHQIGDVKVMLKVGADGSGIESIEKTGTSGIVDTYTITMTDGSKSTFTVTNGSSIESIEKTSTVGLVDTYTITLTNGDTSTFEVHNASGGGMLAHILITSDAGSTVTVTTPSGDVITATQVTGSTTQWECDTQEYGVHIIDAVLDGEDEQVTLTVDTCKVYSIDDSHVHASITVTYPQGFTCRCQGNGENYYANSNPYTFSVHSLGTFTITATDGTTTYTETVVISSSSQAETIYCPSVANAPTEDVQLWLMYGDITDKNYTTLSEVLADTTTYSALIADHDAVDYLKRSIGWASNKGLVPTMTSDTTPSGEAFGSSNAGSGYHYYFVFNDEYTGSGAWIPLVNEAPSWVGYHFPESQEVASACVTFYQTKGSSNVRYKLQGSTDGSTYVDLTDELTSGNYSSKTLIPVTKNKGSYNYYRLYFIDAISTTSITVRPAMLQFYAYDGNGITEDSTAMSILGLNNYASDTLLSDADWLEAICNSQYFESVLNAKVPVMSSNTTPSGECSADVNSANAFYAFDGNVGTYYNGAKVSGTTSRTGWLQYKFNTPVVVHMIEVITSSGDNWSNGIVSVSDDNSSYTNIATFPEEHKGLNYQPSYHRFVGVIANSLSKLYHRFTCTSCRVGGTTGNYDEPGIYTLQFYGRADV